jgi:eukaryotic-like serine/threonine-protein kinase
MSNDEIKISETIAVDPISVMRPNATTKGGSSTEDTKLSASMVKAALGSGDYSFLEPAQSADEIGRLGTYRILRMLSSGGMGLVFQAEDIQLRRVVALKVMRKEAAAHPTARARFLREARAAAQVEHTHIVSVHQVGEANGVVYLAMAWLKGCTLDDYLKRGRVKPGQAIRIGRQVALGLAAAHENGLIHRDIKPANIWIEQGGNIKILDFGLARAVTEDANLTRAGAILGTPAYMAPEQARGEKVDHRCDLYSLGVVMYRMVTGRMPTKGETTIAALMSLAMDVPPEPCAVEPEIPEDLSNLIMELLAKDPARRPPSAKDLVDRLLQIGKSSSGNFSPGENSIIAASKTPKEQEKPASVWVGLNLERKPANRKNANRSALASGKGKDHLWIAIAGLALLAVLMVAGVVTCLRPA